MKTNTLIITFLLLSLSLRAQDFEWAKSFGASSDDRSLSIAVDASGNSYVVGYFVGTVDFDPGAGTTNLVSHGDRDIFIQKMNASGDFLWAKTFGGSGADYGFSICIDNSNNLLITGYFEQTVDFDPGVGTDLHTSAGSSDVFVQKLDASGNYIWAKSFGGPDLEQAASISVDHSANIYITGAFGGNSVDFDPGAGTTTITGNGYTDVFVEKLDSNGNFLWVRAFGGTELDVSTTVKTDISGNIYTYGRFSGTMDFDPGAGTTNLTTVGMDDVFIQKIDAAGNFLWAKSFGSTITDYGSSLNVDPFGNVYTIGRFGSTADFDPGAGISNLTSTGNVDVFVQKLDANGNFLWARSFGGSNSDIGFSVCSDLSGNVYTVGYFTGTVDFDPNPTGTSILTDSGTIQAFIQKMDASGNFLWVKSFGGTAAENSTSIYVDGAGNIYTTGVFNETADFDPDPTGTANLISNGASDVFIQKLSQSTAGINEQKENIQITANPNPSNGIVSVTFNQTKYDVKLVLTDLQGQIIFKQNYSTLSSIDMKVPDMSGVYLLNIMMSGENKVLRLVKD